MGGDDNEPRCRSAPPSPVTTMSCSISTAACGSATRPSTARSTRSPRCARPARGSRSSRTTCATRPTTSSASSGGSASRPAWTRWSPCGAALQFVLAERRDGGAAFVIGSQALVDHVADAGLRVVNNTEFATRADVVVVGGHEAFDYRELRIATQAVLRGAELIGDDARPHVPDARRSLAGLRRGARGGRGGDRPARPSGPWASPSRTCTRPRATGSGQAATSRSATGSTSTSRARGAPGIDSALVLTRRDAARRGGRRRPAADARRRLARRARAGLRIF